MIEPVTPQPVESETGEKASGRALAAMIIGICSIVFGWCGIGILGIILGIVALILGIMERKAIASGQSSEKGKVFALVGLITGIVGIIGGVIVLIVFLAVGAFSFIPFLTSPSNF
jgi:hypothetical protein